MSPTRSSASAPQEKADKPFDEFGISEALGIRQELGRAKSKVERKTMRDQIKEAGKVAKEYIKDPEKRKEAMVLLGAGLLLLMFKGDAELDEEFETEEEAR